MGGFNKEIITSNRKRVKLCAMKLLMPKDGGRGRKPSDKKFFTSNRRRFLKKKKNHGGVRGENPLTKICHKK